MVGCVELVVDLLYTATRNKGHKREYKYIRIYFKFYCWKSQIKEGLQMKFRGNYSYSIDSKGRVMLPNEIRSVMTERSIDRFVVLPGFSVDYKYLFILPKDFSNTIESKLESLKFFDVKAQQIFTFFFGNSFEVQADGQGRIRIPSGLVAKFGFAKEVVITGEGDFLKLWIPEDYKQMMEKEFTGDMENITDILNSINEKYDI